MPPRREEIRNFYYPTEIGEVKHRMNTFFPPPAGQVGTYTSKKDEFIIVNLLCTVSAIGLARHCGGPGGTRRTDLYRTLKLIDSTNVSSPLTIVFFAPTFDQLPNVRSVGDTISVENAEITYYKGDIFAKVRTVPDSSYALFHGKNVNRIYHATSHRRPFKASEKFATLPLGNQFSSGLDVYQSKIKDVRFEGEGVYFDLVCKIVNITEDEDDHLIISVWDGTTYKYIIEMEEELSTQYLQVVPYLGTILKVRVRVQFEDVSRLQEGTWIRMQNLSSWVEGELCRGKCVMESKRSSIFIISTNDVSVQSCLRGHVPDDPIQLD